MTHGRGGWLSLRGKASHYRFDGPVSGLQERLRAADADQWLIPALALALGGLLLWVIPTGRVCADWLLFAAAAFIIHFRFKVFFYLDDLEYLERILDHGFASILLTQNEHFIPVFSTIFYVVAHLAEDRYLLYSALTFLVHATNGVLLYRFLLRLSGDTTHGTAAARVLSVLYVLSGLHGEVLQWFTCSAVAWAIATQLWCLNAAWDFLMSGRRSAWVQAVVAAALGPLIFGGAFDLALKLCGLALVGWYSVSQVQWRKYASACAAVLLPVAVLYGLELIAYFAFQTGQGVSQTPLQEAEMPDLWLVLRYVLLGAQFGSLYRGLLLASGLHYDDYTGSFLGAGLSALPHQDLRMSIPGCVQLIFNRRIQKNTPSRFRSRVMTQGVVPSLWIDYKSSTVKQYFKEGRAIRTETTVNNTRDFGTGRRIENLTPLREMAFAANRRLLHVQQLDHDPTLGQDDFEALTQPTLVDGQRASGLKFGDPVVLAVLTALLIFRLLPRGFSNRDLRDHVAQLLTRRPGEFTPAG